MKQAALTLRRIGIWLLALWMCVRLLDIPAVEQLIFLLPYAEGALTLLCLVLLRPKDDPALWLLGAGCLWLFVVTAIQGLDAFSPARYVLANALFACFVCWPGGDPKTLRGTCTILVICMGTLSVIGLCAALTGSRIYSFSADHYAGLRKGRLYLFRYPTQAGSFLLSGLLCGLWLWQDRKERRWHITLGILMACMFLCLGLTDTRTAFVALGAAVGCAIASALLRRGKNGWVACAAGVASLLLCYLLLAGVSAAYNWLRIPSGGKIYLNQYLRLDVSAGAEEVVTAKHRTVDSGTLLSGRLAVWAAFGKLIREQPRVLLTGLGTLHPMDSIQPLVTGSNLTYEHLHNILLQTLAETGLPGLLLLIGFLAMVLRRIWQLRKDPAFTLAIVPLGLLVADMAEVHLLLSAYNPAWLLFMLFTGALMRTEPQRGHV